MGRIFLEHMGGSRLFSCAKCDTNLTNRSELISTRFTGATGRAFLFNRVVNLTYSEVQDRVMLTGRHMVNITFKICLFNLYIRVVFTPLNKFCPSDVGFEITNP